MPTDDKGDLFSAAHLPLFNLARQFGRTPLTPLNIQQHDEGIPVERAYDAFPFIFDAFSLCTRRTFS